MNDMTTDVFYYAVKYLEQGISAVPCIITRDRKYPNYAWKRYQKRRMSAKEFRFLYHSNKCNGIGFICGSISGNIEVLDFDLKNEPNGIFYENFVRIFSEMYPSLYKEMLIVRTINDGFHWIYRTENGVKGNLKLARGVNKETLIETRGEGGFVAAVPSEGYEICNGSFKNLVLLTIDQYDFVHHLAKQFDNLRSR